MKKKKPFRYSLTLSTARPLTTAELEQVSRAAVEAAAAIVGVSPEAPRVVRRGYGPAQKVKAA